MPFRGGAPPSEPPPKPPDLVAQEAARAGQVHIRESTSEDEPEPTDRPPGSA